MAVNVKSLKMGNILALDCSSTKSGITIIDSKGRIIRALQIHFVNRSVNKVKIPHVEIKDFTVDPEDGELIVKRSLEETPYEKMDFLTRAKLLKYYLCYYIENHEVDQLFIEDYAYYSTGKTVDLIEMTAIMKYLISEETELEWVRVSPTTLKSYNCGAPNASKEDMRAALELSTGIYFKSFDVVDSTVLARLGYEIKDHLDEIVEDGILRSSYKKFIKKAQ